MWYKLSPFYRIGKLVEKVLTRDSQMYKCILTLPTTVRYYNFCAFTVNGKSNHFFTLFPFLVLTKIDELNRSNPTAQCHYFLLKTNAILIKKKGGLSRQNKCVNVFLTRAFCVS